jgi:ferredoxin
MFKDNLIEKALRSTDFPIVIDRSRCMRMRLNRNDCPVCISNCHANAISFGDDIAIDADKCTLCMVCVSECPADCFDIKGCDFLGILARLRSIQGSVPYPVLGCRTSSTVAAHERTVCLGALSDEHLIALSVFVDKPVRLNLTSCATCKNSFIVDTLKVRIADIKENSGIDVSGEIVVVEDRADLLFEEVPYDRRGFFSALKNLTLIQAAGLLENNERGNIQSYSQKKLPLKRDMLNTIIVKIADRDRTGRLLQEYAFTIEADASCDNCFSCVGMCPTGALKNSRDETGSALLFNPSMCYGCALCRDFCLNKSIALLHGYSGENYFEYGVCTRNSGTTARETRGEGLRLNSVMDDRRDQ